MKRHFFLTAFLLLFSEFAMAQAPSIPACDGYDATGAPIATATGSTLCTDYFGSPNWANSPLPAGTILSYTVLSGGSGYINPTVVITHITGTGASATATVDTANGNSLGIGASCAINVRFSPTSRGTLNATLQVTDNAPNSPQMAALTGTGQ